MPRYVVVCMLVCALLRSAQGFARTNSGVTSTTVQNSQSFRDGQHDFDFEFGAWTAHLARLLHPLTGSTTWVHYVGTSVVRKIWNGRANYGELEVSGPAGHIEGLTLRLYDPQSHQWKISWASSSDGTLGQPMIGAFKNGHGEFFDQELLDGRAICVRFIFSDITPNAFRFEQAFSDDGGVTWEVNWIATFARVRRAA
jgi:hypothetical protein